MCGRYTLSDPGDLALELGVETTETIQARYNIAPTQDAPVIRPTGDGRELAHLRWGLVPFWAKDPSIGNKMINARSETAHEKPSFKHALKKRRCAILTDGFYEWKKMGSSKQPFHIHFPERRPFLFAGLWERWSKGDEPLETFTILTTANNETLSELHHRMPVILPKDGIDAWLDPGIDDPEALAPLMRPWRGAELQLTPVSKLVNSPANDRPECLEPIEL